MLLVPLASIVLKEHHNLLPLHQELTNQILELVPLKLVSCVILAITALTKVKPIILVTFVNKVTTVLLVHQAQPKLLVQPALSLIEEVFIIL